MHEKKDAFNNTKKQYENSVECIQVSCCFCDMSAKIIHLIKTDAICTWVKKINNAI